MSQDLGPIPRDQEGLQGWPNAFAFFFYRQISVWNFMQTLRVNVFSKLAMSQGLRPIPCHWEGLQGWPDTFAFLSFVEHQFRILSKV